VSWSVGLAKLFLSHSSKDNFEALALAQWLTAEGFVDLFLDIDPERGIAAGERWERKLTEESDRCEAVIFLVSQHWLASAWCLRELSLAQKLTKQIFVVLIDDIKIESLPKDLTRTFQTVNLAAGDDHKPHRVKYPVTGEEAHVTFSEGGLKRLKTGLKKAGLDPSHFDWPPKSEPHRAPWQGLKSLSTDDAGIFFGRDAPIIDALDMLRGLSDAGKDKLFVILGASGAGKSSFLRAGLWPRLARDDARYVTLPIIRPAQGVLSSDEGLVSALAAAQGIGKALNRADIRKAIDQGRMAEMLMEMAGGRTLVFAIDQAEELFQATGREESGLFLNLVAEIAAADAPRAIFIFTIRSDAYEPLQTAPQLEGLKPKLFPLPPLPQGALSTVIEGPVERLNRAGRKLVIEPALTQKLLADLAAGGGKDTLPLLSFTLERLYTDYGADGDLKLSEYEEFGGLSGAIDTAVKGAFAKAAEDPRVPKDPEAQRSLLRRALIPWLAGIDPETQSPRRMVARRSDIPEECRPLVDHFITARLLTTDKNETTGEETIEPAHEALLRQWGLLKGWLAEDFGKLATLESVKRAARDWDANAKDATWLNHRGARLLDAEALHTREDLAAKLDTRDRAYLAEARAAETAEQQRKDHATRRLRITALAACVLAVLAGMAAWWGLEQAARAEKERERAAFEAEQATNAKTFAEEESVKAVKAAQQALDNESSMLANLSRLERAEGRRANALKLALAAWPRIGDSKRRPFQKVIDPLGQSLLFERQKLVLRGHEKAVISAEFSPDGRHVLTTSEDRTARIWDSQTGQELRKLELPKNIENYAPECTSLDFSSDGERVVLACGEKAYIFEFQTGEVRATLFHQNSQINQARFSPDGNLIVTTIGESASTLSEVSAVKVWDAKSGSMLFELGASSKRAIYAEFSPDGRLVLTVSADSIVRLWDSKLGTEVGQFGDSDNFYIGSATFGPDGNSIITLEPKLIKFWKLSEDRANSALITATLDYQIEVEEQLYQFKVSPVGKRLAVASTGRFGIENEYPVKIWDYGSKAPVAVLIGHDEVLRSIAYSQDGTRIVTASIDNTVRIWDAAASSPEESELTHNSYLNSAFFSSDASRVLTTSADGCLYIWSLNPVEQTVKHCSKLGVTSGGTFSPDNKQIVIVYDNEIATVFDVASVQKTLSLVGHSGLVRTAVYSPDGKHIATASDDMTIKIWNANTGEVVNTLSGHTDSVYSANFSSDGKFLVSASKDKTAIVWELKTGKPISRLVGHESFVLAASFSPGSQRIITTSVDGTIRIWGSIAGNEIKKSS
jgi:WD40 repeat protein